MFSRIAAIAVLALPVLTAATPSPIVARGGGSSAGSCNTGSLQCCNSVQKADSAAAAGVLAAIGVVLQDLNVLVGLSCSPVTVIGVGSGSSCSANTVCCEDNSHNGVISIGCVPVML